MKNQIKLGKGLVFDGNEFRPGKNFAKAIEVSADYVAKQISKYANMPIQTKKKADSVYKQIATVLNSGQYTQKRNRYCAPHMISKPSGSFSMYTLPRRLREMRELSLVVSKPLDKVTGYALTEQGVKLAKSK